MTDANLLADEAKIKEVNDKIKSYRDLFLVVFTKADGTERRMMCSRIEKAKAVAAAEEKEKARIAAGGEPKAPRKTNPNLIYVQEVYVDEKTNTTKSQFRTFDARNVTDMYEIQAGL